MIPRPPGHGFQTVVACPFCPMRRSSQTASTGSLFTVAFTSSSDEPSGPPSGSPPASSSIPAPSTSASFHLSDSSDAASAAPIPSAVPTPDPGPNSGTIPYCAFTLCWTSRVLGHSKSKIRLLDSDDRVIFVAHHRRISGRAVIEFRAPRTASASAALEVHGQGSQYTLRVPKEADGEIEILGLAWDATRDGRAFPQLRALLYYEEPPYASTAKPDRLGAMAHRNAAPPGGMWFRSKVPGTRNERIEGIPEFAPQSRKNLVLEDTKGIVVLRMYKLADETAKIYSVPYFGPIVTLACAIAVIER